MWTEPYGHTVQLRVCYAKLRIPKIHMDASYFARTLVRISDMLTTDK